MVCLISSASLPVNSLRELIDYAKFNPGKVAYGSAGVGSPSHFGGETLKSKAGIDMLHVPFKASIQGVQEVVAGRLQVTFGVSSAFRPLLSSGKIKVLAILADSRFSRMPDAPTMAEIVPGFEVAPGWLGLLGPANLPPPVLARLHSDSVRGLNLVRAKLAEGDFEVTTSKSPEEFAAQIRRETRFVGEMIKRMGLEPE